MSGQEMEFAARTEAETPVFTAHVVMNKEIYEAYNRHMMLGKSRARKVLYYVLGALCLMMGAYVMIGLKIYSMTAFCFVLLGALLLVEPWLLFKLGTRRMLKSDKTIAGSVSDYRFFEREMEGETAFGGGSSESRVPYDVLYSFEESDLLLLLLRNKTTAYVIPKGAVADGKYEELARFLREKIPQKKK
jgi:hypothetical protein